MLLPISIGNNCKPRYQIDRFMTRVIRDYRPINLFFDSLMMGNISGVCDIIERDFILKRDDIYTKKVNDKYVPGDRNSGMIFLHDFGCRHASWEKSEECEYHLKLAMDNSLQKYAYLGERTRKLLSSNFKIGLIYYGKESQDNFKKLIELLEYKYKRAFKIINVLELGVDEPTVMDGSVENIFVEDSKSPKKGTNQEWQGWDQSWSTALASALVVP